MKKNIHQSGECFLLFGLYGLKQDFYGKGKEVNAKNPGHSIA
jgi:hypothetical protein